MDGPNGVLFWCIRATTSIRENFLSILQEKTYFFYFTHLLLQNTHISLSILHIYSIKYSFFLHFLLFPSLSSLELSHRPNTNPKSPTPSHRLLRQVTNPTQTQNHPHPTSHRLLCQATNPTQTQNHPHPATSHHQRSNRTNPLESPTFITPSFITASHQWMQNPPSTRSIPTNQYPIIVASSKPTHHVPKSSATASFFGLVHHGLLVEIVSAMSEIGEIDGLRWDRWTEGEMKQERGESENFLSKREVRWEEIETNYKIIDTRATVTVYIYTFLHPLIWVFFCSKCVKLVLFSILEDYTRPDVVALRYLLRSIGGPTFLSN